MRFPHDRLFFIYMPGCPVCVEMKSVVRAFRDAHPEVQVIPLDITVTPWEATKWMPSVTPTLVKLARNGTYRVFEGDLAPEGQGRIVKKEDMETWLTLNF